MNQDVMGLPLVIGSKVIPVDSGWNFVNFRDKGNYWKVAGFTPKMVKIETISQTAMLKKRTIYGNLLLNLEPYTTNYPELFL